MQVLSRPWPCRHYFVDLQRCHLPLFQMSEHPLTSSLQLPICHHVLYEAGARSEQEPVNWHTGNQGHHTPSRLSHGTHLAVDEVYTNSGPQRNQQEQMNLPGPRPVPSATPVKKPSNPNSPRSASRIDGDLLPCCLGTTHTCSLAQRRVRLVSATRPTDRRCTSHEHVRADGCYVDALVRKRLRIRVLVPELVAVISSSNPINC